jgi:septum formation protein
MLLKKLDKYQIILGTQSPRRHLLMRECGFKFDVIIAEGIEENFPANMPVADVPVFLAEHKANWFKGKLKENQILITADTVVIFENQIIVKPADRDDAVSMLKKLSGNRHDVITGVCITSVKKKVSFSNLSAVYFTNFTDEEIEYYVNKYKPYDKAGSYGAQEWIGYIGIDRIEGSFFNVMGLPVHQLYKELEKFVENV